MLDPSHWMSQVPHSTSFRSRCDSHVSNAWLSVSPISEVQEWVQALAKAAWDLCQARMGDFHPFFLGKNRCFCQMFFNDMLPGGMGKGMGPPMGMGPEPCDVRLMEIWVSAGARNSVSRPRMGGKGMGGCGVELRTSWLSRWTCFMSPRSYTLW